MNNIGAAVDITGLIAVVVFILIAVNVVREVIRQARLQQEQERERRMRGDAPPPQSRTTVRQRPPAPKQQGDLQDFLDEIARRTGLPVPEQRTPPPPRPQHPPVPRQVPQKVYRPKAIPTVSPVKRQKAATVAGAKVVYSGKAAKALETAPSLEVHNEKKTGAPGENITALLADRPLAHAVALREILGPCRAMAPYRPGRAR